MARTSSFSERYELSKASIIVDDAPGWFRPIFFEQVLRGLLHEESLYGTPDRSTRPVSSTGLLEHMAQVSRRKLDDLYLVPGNGIDFLRSFLMACEWYFFYEAVEVVAGRVLARDKQQSWAPEKLYPDMMSNANYVFRTSAIGWTLAQTGLLERSQTEEREMAESQLLTLEIHSPAKVHLAKARLMLQQRPCDAANCIKEAVSAIESAGKKAFPGTDTLGDVLKEIKKRSAVPPLLISAVEKLYGFANSEAGVRHGSTEDEKVTRAEAEFVYVNALSLITYFEALGIF